MTIYKVQTCSMTSYLKSLLVAQNCTQPMLSQGLPKIILESVFARYVLRVKYQDQDRAMILQEMTFNMVSRVITHQWRCFVIKVLKNALFLSHQWTQKSNPGASHHERLQTGSCPARHGISINITWNHQFSTHWQLRLSSTLWPSLR